MDIEIFLRGLVLGFSIAAPIGPIGVLCIRRTFADGQAIGFISGLGAATADAIYSSIAAFGLTFISSLLIEQHAWLRLIGGFFLCYLGVKTFLAKPAGEEIGLHLAPAVASSGPVSFGSLAAAYTSTVFLTLTNPLTILSFTAIFAGLGIASSVDHSSVALALVFGVFLGSTTWWLLLSTIAHTLRSRFLKPKRLQWVNWISGLSIAVFGLLSLVVLSLTDIWYNSSHNHAIGRGRNAKETECPRSDRRRGTENCSTSQIPHRAGPFSAAGQAHPGHAHRPEPAGWPSSPAGRIRK